MTQQNKRSVKLIGAAFVAGMVVAAPAFAEESSLELGKNFVPMQDAALQTVGASSSRRTADEELDRSGNAGSGPIGGATPETGGKVAQAPSQFSIMSNQTTTVTSPPPSVTSPTTTTTTTGTGSTFLSGITSPFSR